jgi:Protein of unknown function (DUF1569)
MAVDTKTVEGRRKLNFPTFEAMIADAEQLVASPNTKMLGNWPLGTLLAHLAMPINGSIDGIPFKAPWKVRLLAPLIKRRVFKKGMSSGFKLPDFAETRAFPTGLSPQEGLERFKAATARVRTEKMTAKHPVLGKLTHEEWTRFHLRHAEMHLSFAVPA